VVDGICRSCLCWNRCRGNRLGPTPRFSGRGKSGKVASTSGIVKSQALSIAVSEFRRLLRRAKPSLRSSGLPRFILNQTTGRRNEKAKRHNTSQVRGISCLGDRNVLEQAASFLEDEGPMVPSLEVAIRMLLRTSKSEPSRGPKTAEETTNS
jgi:hypothetical protein